MRTYGFYKKFILLFILTNYFKSRFSGADFLVLRFLNYIYFTKAVLKFDYL
jgi:hypothetical protein